MLPSLSARNIPAKASASCDGVVVDLSIRYDKIPTETETPIQQDIRAIFQEPSSAVQGWLGDIECWFDDGKHVSALTFHGNFSAAKKVLLELPNDAVPAFLDAPTDARRTLDGITEISIDYGANIIRIDQRSRSVEKWFLLADDAYIGLDSEGHFASLIATGVDWISDEAV